MAVAKRYKNINITGTGVVMHWIEMMSNGWEGVI